MPIKPNSGESQTKFMARCMTKESKDNKRSQTIAICISKWKNKDKK